MNANQIHNPRDIFRLHSSDMFARRLRMLARGCSQASGAICSKLSAANNWNSIWSRARLYASPARWNLNYEFAWRLMISSSSAALSRSFSKSRSPLIFGAVDAPTHALIFLPSFASFIFVECLWASTRVNIKKRYTILWCAMMFRIHLESPHTPTPRRSSSCEIY